MKYEMYVGTKYIGSSNSRDVLRKKTIQYIERYGFEEGVAYYPLMKNAKTGKLVGRMVHLRTRGRIYAWVWQDMIRLPKEDSRDAYISKKTGKLYYKGE